MADGIWKGVWTALPALPDHQGVSIPLVQRTVKSQGILAPILVVHPTLVVLRLPLVDNQSAESEVVHWWLR